MGPAVAAGFILFQGRLLNTAQIITVAPPRPDKGRFIIEARVVGGASYTEEYDDPDEAAGRYLAIAADLLEDPSIARGVKQPGSAGGRGKLAEVTVLPERDPLLRS